MAACLLLAAEVVLAALSAAFPPPMAKLDHASPVVVDRQGRILRALPVERGRWRLRADLAHVDPLFVRRLVALEDARFYAHPGVDPLAALRAAGGDILARRVRSGGSTLDMQLARRLNPRPRTLAAKLVESLRALQLDAGLGKHGVLAAYLTLTPYGGNLEGVRAASLAWFGHEPDHLDDAEQALLIALPQAPEARRPDRHPATARAARWRILGRLERARLITPEARALAEAEPLPRRQALPAFAWQVAGRLAASAPPRAAQVVSTLDAPLQVRLETLAHEAAAAQGPQTQVAILVVEARMRAVRAAVASAGRERPGGWMDLTRAFRSPGSALKPFVYAMAFEGGQAAPDTRIVDAPAAYAGGYSPRDFDRAFRGEVTAREALQGSLNVPAVHVLAAVGPGVFEARLRAAGVALRRPKAGLADPSLALALGGEGVRLEDVAMLYAALADGGVAKPLAWTEADAARRPREDGQRLVSAAAAAQVLDVLRGTPAPDGRASPLLGGGAPLAFKTGTSYGFRDALAAGVGGGYAVVVWTGRPDGGGRPGLTGRQAALPLLFDVFDHLRAERGPESAGALTAAPQALQQMAGADDPPPRMIFPPDRARLQLDRFGPRGPGLAMTATGRGLRWYADNAPIPIDPATGQTIWRPAAPGFYHLEVVDAEGRRAVSRLRVEP